MDAPSHTGTKIVFQPLQILAREARGGYEADAQDVQRLLLELALYDIADAFQNGVQAA